LRKLYTNLGTPGEQSQCFTTFIKAKRRKVAGVQDAIVKAE